MDFLKKRPVLRAVVFFLVVVLPWVAAVAPLFSDRPLIQIVLERLGGPGVTPTIWYYVATGISTIGLILLATVVYQTYVARTHVLTMKHEYPANPTGRCEILASYYMRVTTLRNMLIGQQPLSEMAVRDVDRRLNEIRDSLRHADTLFSPQTAVAFNAPQLDQDRLEDRVLANANDLLRVLHRKWEAWGGNREGAPLGEGTPLGVPGIGD